MKAGFYQFAPAFGRKAENLEKVFSAAADSGIDLLVLPEFFATGYQFTSPEEVSRAAEAIPDGETTQQVMAFSQAEGMFIAAGLPESRDGRFYNSAILTGPSGFIGVYRKTHLFFEENLYFTPGNDGFTVWDTSIGRIGMMICFDWFFPEAMRTLAVLGAEVVVHPANLVLPYCPDAMTLRCLENRVFAITANRTGRESRKAGSSLTFIGQSEIVSPRGEILLRASGEDDAFLYTEIDPALARDKSLNPYNEIMQDRRPDQYAPLVHRAER